MKTREYIKASEDSPGASVQFTVEPFSKKLFLPIVQIVSNLKTHG
jgi:hypothetical protein